MLPILPKLLTNFRRILLAASFFVILSGIVPFSCPWIFAQSQTISSYRQLSSGTLGQLYLQNGTLTIAQNATVNFDMSLEPDQQTHFGSESILNGAIYLLNGSSLTLRNATYLIDNGLYYDSSAEGGAMYAEGDFYFYGESLRTSSPNLYFRNNLAWGRNSQTYSSTTSNYIRENRLLSGGEDLSIQTSTQGKGGAIMLDGTYSDMYFNTIHAITFDSNEAQALLYRDISVASGKTIAFEISDGIYSGEYIDGAAIEAGGGALFVESGYNSVNFEDIDNINFTNNLALARLKITTQGASTTRITTGVYRQIATGGAIHVNSGDSSVNFSDIYGTLLFQGNEARSEFDITRNSSGANFTFNHTQIAIGGAITGNVNFTDVNELVFRNNKAYALMNVTTPIATNDSIVQAYGGAMYISDAMTLNTGGDVLFSGNQAVAVGGGTREARGGAIYVADTTLTLAPIDGTTITFENNRTRTASSLSSTYTTLYNSIHLEDADLYITGAGVVDMQDPMTGMASSAGGVYVLMNSGYWSLGGSSLFEATREAYDGTQFSLTGGELYLTSGASINLRGAASDFHIYNGGLLTVSGVGGTNEVNVQRTDDNSRLILAGQINIDAGGSLGFDLTEGNRLLPSLNTPQARAMLGLNAASFYISPNANIDIRHLYLPSDESLNNSYDFYLAKTTNNNGGDFSDYQEYGLLLGGTDISDTRFADGLLLWTKENDTQLWLTHNLGAIERVVNTWTGTSQVDPGTWNVGAQNWTDAPSLMFAPGDIVNFDNLNANTTAEILLGGGLVSGMFVSSAADGTSQDYYFSGRGVWADAELWGGNFADDLVNNTAANGKLVIGANAYMDGGYAVIGNPTGYTGTVDFTAVSYENTFVNGIDMYGGTLRIFKAGHLGTDLSKLNFQSGYGSTPRLLVAQQGNVALTGAMGDQRLELTNDNSGIIELETAAGFSVSGNNSAGKDGGVFYIGNNSTLTLQSADNTRFIFTNNRDQNGSNDIYIDQGTLNLDIGLRRTSSGDGTFVDAAALEMDGGMRGTTAEINKTGNGLWLLGGTSVFDRANLDIQGGSLELSRGATLDLGTRGTFSMDSATGREMLLIANGSNSIRADSIYFGNDTGIKMGDNIAVLRLDGDVTLDTGSTFYVRYDPDKSYVTSESTPSSDRINAAGNTVDIASGVTLDVSNSGTGRIAGNQQKKYLIVAGTVTGLFDDVPDNKKVLIDQYIDNTGLYLILTGKVFDFGTPRSYNAAQAAAAAVSISADGKDLELGALGDELFNISETTLENSEHAFNQLHGEAYASSREASVRLQRRFIKQLPSARDRYVVVMDNPDDVIWRGQAASSLGVMDLKGQSCNNNSGNKVAFNRWADMNGDWLHRGKIKSGQFSGYEISGGGVSLGFDTLIEEVLTFGIAFGYDYASQHFKNLRSNAHMNIFRLAGYGSYRYGPLYTNAYVGYTSNDYRVHRNIDIGNFNVSTLGKYDDGMFSAGLETGYILNLGNSQLTSSIGLDYIISDGEDLTETGGAEANLHVELKSYQSVRIPIGLRWSRRCEGDILFIPEFRAFLIPELGDDSVHARTAFDILRRYQFDASSGDWGRMSGQFGVGFKVAMSENFSFRLDYDYEVYGRTGFGEFGISGRLCW